jgi:hypothetical protein
MFVASLVVVGFAIWFGGRMVRQERLELTCYRCEDHSHDREWPQCRLAGRDLWLSVGSPRMRRAYLRATRRPLESPSPQEIEAKLAADREANRKLRDRRPLFALAAGYMWLTMGYLQWVAAVIEVLALMLAGIAAGPENQGAVIMVLVVYGGIRFRIAQAFQDTGRQTIDQESPEIISSGLASIGLGVACAIPAVVVLGRYDVPMFETRDLGNDPALRVIMISLSVWATAMVVAGVLAVAGNTAYLGNTPHKRKSLFQLPCPACWGPYGVDSSDLGSLVTCPDCGEMFRLEKPG